MNDFMNSDYALSTSGQNCTNKTTMRVIDPIIRIIGCNRLQSVSVDKIGIAHTEYG